MAASASGLTGTPAREEPEACPQHQDPEQQPGERTGHQDQRIVAVSLGALVGTEATQAVQQDLRRQPVASGHQRVPELVHEDAHAHTEREHQPLSPAQLVHVERAEQEEPGADPHRDAPDGENAKTGHPRKVVCAG
jgi:hypothetical protein